MYRCKFFGHDTVVAEDTKSSGTFLFCQRCYAVMPLKFNRLATNTGK